MTTNAMAWRALRSFPLENCFAKSKPQRPLNVAAITRVAPFTKFPHDHIKPSQVQQLAGIGSGGYRPIAYASNAHNEAQALRGRVLCQTPVVDVGFVRQKIRWLKQNHKHIFPGMTNVQQVSNESYVENSNASPSVKRMIEEEFARMKAGGFDCHTRYNKGELRQYTKRSAFVKVENTNHRTPAGLTYKACRLIQGIAQPRFTCTVGPWMVGCQGRLKRVWTSNNFICFTSGVTSTDAAACLMSLPGSYLEDDIGTFDASVCREWLEYEVWLCKKFGAPRAVIAMMKANIDTHGTTLNGWKYFADGQRKSGDPYTSLMNSILNACMHLSLYHDYTGKNIHEIKQSLRMLVQGDDNAMKHVEKDRFPWVRDMARLGFKSEAVYRKHAHLMEFCSNRLTPTSEGWTFVPKPGKVLSKIGYFIAPPTNVHPKSLVRGVAMGLYVAASASPPIRAYLDRLLTLTDGYDAFQPKFEEWKMKYKVHTPNAATWAALYDVYGWDHERQRLFEQDLQHVQLGDDLDTPLAYSLYDFDTSGPACVFTPIPVT